MSVFVKTEGLELVVAAVKKQAEDDGISETYGVKMYLKALDDVLKLIHRLPCVNIPDNTPLEGENTGVGDK